MRIRKGEGKGEVGKGDWRRERGQIKRGKG